MKYILPNNLRDIVSGRKYGKRYQQIRKVIKHISGLSLIQMDKNDEQNYNRFYDMSHLYIYESEDSINWEYTPAYLECFLAFDNFYSRFVAFQFTKEFNYENSLQSKRIGLNNGIAQDFTSIKVNPKSKEIIKRKKVNPELTKLVVIAEHIPTSELLKYLGNAEILAPETRGIELWTIKDLDNVPYIEKVQNDFNEELVFPNHNSDDYFKYFKISDKTKSKFYLFKEFLRYNLPARLISSFRYDAERIKALHLELFDSEFSWDYNEGPEDLSTKEKLQSFLDSLIEGYNSHHSEDGKEKNTVTYLDYSNLYIKAKIPENNNTLYIDFFFEKKCIVPVIWFFNESEGPFIFRKRLKISSKTNYNEIKEYLTPILNCLQQSNPGSNINLKKFGLETKELSTLY